MLVYDYLRKVDGTASIPEIIPWIIWLIILKSNYKGLAYGALATVPPIHGLYTGEQ